jgi:hypothetical protein
MLTKFTIALIPAAVCAATLLAGPPGQAAIRTGVQPASSHAPAAVALDVPGVGTGSVGPWDYALERTITDR